MNKMTKFLIGAWLLLAITMHLLGTGYYIDGTRLYDIWIWNIKYDMLVHFVNSLFLAIIISGLFRFRRWLTVLVVLGIGAAFELIEFISVLFFNGAEVVGDYMNNALDNLFNLFGALTGTLMIRKKKYDKRTNTKKGN